MTPGGKQTKKATGGGSERSVCRARGRAGARRAGLQAPRERGTRRGAAQKARELPGRGAAPRPDRGRRSRRPGGGGSLLHLGRRSRPLLRARSAAARGARHCGPGSGQAAAPRILVRRRRPPRQLQDNPDYITEDKVCPKPSEGSQKKGTITREASCDPDCVGGFPPVKEHPIVLFVKLIFFHLPKL